MDKKIRFCDYSCPYIKFNEKPAPCRTFDVIYCTKYKVERDKGAICLDHVRNRLEDKV
ncbi:MAG: hypothetical protein ABIH25_04835 [Candidatus Woesearchaeota archaeon]